MSFLDMAQDLMVDEEAKAAFDADPDAFLAARGFDGMSPAEVVEAVGFVADTLPAEAATRVSVAEPDVDGLARLARLDPAVLGPDPADEGMPGSDAVWEHDPSGELDLVTPASGPDLDGPDVDGPDVDEPGPEEPGPEEPNPEDPGVGADEEPGTEARAVEASGAGDGDGDGEPADDASPFARLDDDEPEPGFGVGWEPGDADDVTAASPEFAHALDHPFDTELDATHLPDLALEAADPINEAVHWADEKWAHDQASASDHLGEDLGDHHGALGHGALDHGALDQHAGDEPPDDGHHDAPVDL